MLKFIIGVLLAAFFPTCFGQGWLDQSMWDIQWPAECQQSGGAKQCVASIPGAVTWYDYEPTPADFSGFAPPNDYFNACTATLIREDIGAASIHPGGWYKGQSSVRTYLVTGHYSGQPGQPPCSVSQERGWSRYWNRPDVTCPGGYSWTFYTFPAPQQTVCVKIPTDCCAKTHVGNPIDVIAAAKVQVEIGIDSPIIPFAYRYNSTGFSRPKGAGLSDSLKVFGDFWRHNYQSSVHLDPAGSLANVVGPEGGVQAFLRSGASWKPLSHSRATLTELRTSGSLTGWLLRLPGNTYEQFDANGRPVVRMDASGARLDSSYTDGSAAGPNGGLTLDTLTALPAGLLRRVVDGRGRALVFDYVASSELRRVTRPDGLAIVFQTSKGRLESVAFPDSSSKSYVYRDEDNIGSTMPWLLTGIIDELGVRKSTFQYDTSGRPVSTENAGGVNRFTVSYATAPTATGSPATMPVLDPLSSTRSFGMQRISDVYRVTSETRPCGVSGCVGNSTSTTIYDPATGNVVESRDFAGNGLCFQPDPVRKLEIVRVEGLSPTSTCASHLPAGSALSVGARKIHTQWHPDLELELKRAEPGKVTSWIYNGQPDPFNGNAVASCAPATALLPDGKPIAVVCKRVEEATTDSDGHLGFGATPQPGVANRTFQWTYDAFGQKLTAIDPRGYPTSYAYYPSTAFTGTDPNAVGHYVGDLQTITNAVGRITTFNKYNKHGQVLEVQDPNGVLTINTYDARQRLQSISVGGQPTNYEYYPTGQLFKVTAADGSWIGFEYDAAQRMRAVNDNLGNRIEYTLDDAGNRRVKNVKDAGGVLRRQLGRDIDALGRVQLITGRE